MMPQPIITYTPAFPTKVSPDRGGNYAVLLDRYSISYTEVAGHLHIGKPQQIQGWLLHLSVIQIQVPLLLEKVLPVLQAEKTPFKIPTDATQVEYLLSGAAGYHRLGKVVTIYPLSDQQALVLAQKLIDCTKEFKGPAIPTDRHLGACVYTRYGGFKPVYLTNEDGQTEAYIADYRANMIKDDYFIPFRLPKGIHWPFGQLVKPYPPKASKLLHKRYLPIQTVKNDVKGKVIKALDLKNWLSIRWCILKQGRQCMSADAAGRSIKDRLLWQKEVYQDLKGTIRVPEIYDYFEWRDDVWLVMEYIEGPSLREYIDEIYQGRTWFDLPSSLRLQLLEALYDIIELLEKLHAKGYIHRDCTPRNFLLDQEGQWAAIDLELCYNIHRQKPNPAFSLGTAGYVSPEQKVTQTPTIAQDIYGLGALIIEFFTGISPTKFETSHTNKLRNHLFYCIRDESIADMISDCMRISPQARPQLSHVKLFIDIYTGELLKDGQPEQLPADALSQTIHQGLQTLVTPQFTGPDGIWFTKKDNSSKLVHNEITEYTFSPGWGKGVAGILWLLARAKIAGYDTQSLIATIQNNLAYLTQYTQLLPGIHPGLSNGAAGIALSLSACIKAGWVENTETNRLLIRDCLALPNTDLNLYNGLAGQGIALMECRELLEAEWVNTCLDKICLHLLQQQQKDGSWILTKKSIQEKGVQLFGLWEGIAGILYFLLQYGSAYSQKEALAGAKKGLNYLSGQALYKNNHWLWPLHPSNPTITHWISDGYTGIALVFIKGYEVFQEDRYKELAESALSHHPAHIMSNQLTLADGIAGLGEVYLEAYRVFQNEEWQQRAEWIAGLLQHLSMERPDGSLYWLQDHSTIPVPDLLTGHTGIIHFLIRYDKVEKSKNTVSD